MITNNKIIEIFCAFDEFCKNFDAEIEKNLLKGLPKSDGKQRRNRKGQMCESEIMTILLCYHFGTFRNFKHNYIFFVKQHLKSYFPTAIFYNRFVELMPRVFFPLMIFMRLYTFGKCAGISFADSTMIPVYNNVRRYFNTVFADRGYIKQGLFEDLFEQGIHLVHGLKARMKNKLMPMYDKLLLRKRYIIECINELLKNKANLVHSRHRSVHNFIMNLCSALAAYCFFENKPQALPVCAQNTRQLSLF